MPRSAILTSRVLIGGVLYRSGTDVSPIATPGEIVSLVAAGVVTESPSPPAPLPEAKRGDPESAVESADDTPADDAPTNAGDLSALLDPAHVELLATANVHTRGDVVRYIETNRSLTKIHGIGDVTARRIRAALAL